MIPEKLGRFIMKPSTVDIVNTAQNGMTASWSVRPIHSPSVVYAVRFVGHVVAQKCSS